MPGSSISHGPRTVARWVQVAVFGVASLGAVLPASTAFAQSADGDDTWFNGQTTEPAPEPYYSEPDASTEQEPAPAAQPEVQDTDPSALTTFRPALDPYGAWVTDSTYGTVWVPNRDVVGSDFAPYVSRGHWALTADDDWIWASDYPFGWAVFHYGRWVWIAGNGWAWVPGRTYANAWVVWRTPTAGYDYIGWAPMPPTWGWRSGYAFGLWYSPPLPYVFCPSGYAFNYHVHSYIVHDRYLVHDIASHSRVYPTPYHAAARPSLNPAGAPGGRPGPIGPAGVPHGPAMSAARIPSQAIPSSRTLAPAGAVRLSGSRITSTTSLSSDRERFPSSASEARIRSTSPSASRERFPSDSVRRSSPSGGWYGASRPTERMTVSPSSPRTFAPSSPRNYAPSHSYAPSTHNFAPSHSYAPSTHSFAPSSHSFSPSFHMHSGGGGGGHRR